MRRAAALGVAALVLGACATAEDYLQTVNPFRQNRQGAAEPAPGPAAETARPVPTARAEAVAGPDWPNPGGPPSNAPSDAPLARSPSEAWRSEASGSSLTQSAPPIVVGSRALIFDQRRVAAFSLATGEQVWSTSTLRSGERDVGGGGIASDGARVYVATGSRRLMALDAATGAQVWAKDVPEPARGAPTVGAGRVFVVSAGGALYAFSTADGVEAWRFSGGGAAGGLVGATSPAVVGQTVVAPFPSGEVAALDVARGAPRWTATIAPAGLARASTLVADLAGRPVVRDAVVYVGGGGGRLVALAERDGRKLWERDIATAHAPAVIGDLVVALSIHGELVGLDRRTGQPRWSLRLPAGDRWAGPTLAGGTAWVASSGGALIGVDPRAGAIAARASVGEGVSIAPIAAGGRLLVATQRGRLVAFR
jgi:outer membrane protein assembly factor BamB